MKQVITESGNKIVLDKNSFIASGGQADVYGHNDIVIKIMHDPSLLVKKEKIKELSALTTNEVIRPLEYVFDNNKPIGFTTKKVVDSYVLTELCANTFWQKHNVTADLIKQLCENMQKVIQFVHDHNCLIVDNNEFNCLISKAKLNQPYFIDVDSWQTASFPADAIMDTIRDWCSPNTFTRLSDWYSFGVLMCRLFVGIHPYKGNHPKYGKDIKERALANKSIFNKDVTLPSTARNFDIIPDEYKKWLISIFENGKRLPPPLVGGLINAVVIKTTVINKTNNFDIKFVAEYDSDILNYYYVNGQRIVETNKSICVGKIGQNKCGESYIVLDGKVWFVTINSTQMILRDKNSTISFNYTDHFKVFPESIFVLTKDNKLLEISIAFDNIYIKSNCDVLSNASKIYENCIITDMFGTYNALLIDKYKNNTLYYNVILKELNKVKIIDAKYFNKTLMVVYFKDNQYNKIIFKLNTSCTYYNVRTINDIKDNTINFTTLDNNITVHIDSDGVIELFNDDNIKQIKDVDIKMTMKLTNDNNDVMFTSGKKLYSIKSR